MQGDLTISYPASTQLHLCTAPIQQEKKTALSRLSNLQDSVKDLSKSGGGGTVGGGTIRPGSACSGASLLSGPASREVRLLENRQDFPPSLLLSPPPPPAAAAAYPSPPPAAGAAAGEPAGFPSLSPSLMLLCPLPSPCCCLLPPPLHLLQVRQLENRLDKAMLKSNEAQSIQHTYEQVWTGLCVRTWGMHLKGDGEQMGTMHLKGDPATMDTPAMCWPLTLLGLPPAAMSMVLDVCVRIRPLPS